MNFNKKMIAVVLLFTFISWSVISPIYAQDLNGSYGVETNFKVTVENGFDALSDDDIVLYYEGYPIKKSDINAETGEIKQEVSLELLQVEQIKQMEAEQVKQMGNVSLDPILASAINYSYTPIPAGYNEAVV